MFFGKVIGAVIGYLVLGIFGLLVGVFVGHLFDRGLVRTLRFASPENIARIKQSFFETAFLLSGHIAKADGHISQQEVDHTEMVIRQMGLSGDQRNHAIELFRRGAAPDFRPDAAIDAFVATCGPQRQLQQTLLFFLISLALADQQIDRGEHLALQNIAGQLGIDTRALEQMLRMAQAQGHFHRSADGAGVQPGTGLADAYAALGLEESVDDKALKRAYRKLMSENHPDKLIAQGVPDDMIKLATERSQEIQAAYDMVRKSRGLR